MLLLEEENAELRSKVERVTNQMQKLEERFTDL